MVDCGDVVSFHDFELRQPADILRSGAGIGKDVPFQSLRSVVDLWSLPTLLRIDVASRRSCVRLDRDASGLGSGRRLVVSGQYGH
jgi:hypothetical protein